MQKCHHGNTTCLATVVNSYVRELKDGRPDIKLVPLDPLHVDEVGIIQNKDSPVSINLNFKDVLFYGLSNLNITKVV